MKKSVLNQIPIIGQAVIMLFKVVEEYASGNYSFETLDYFLESYGLIAEGTAANIEDYLVK